METLQEVTMTLALLLALLATGQNPTVEPQGMIVTTRRTTGGGLPFEQTLYWMPDRRRSDFRGASGDGNNVTYGPLILAIERCDLGQMFEVNPEDREYTSAPYPPKPFTEAEMRKHNLPRKLEYLSQHPTVRYEITTEDTGERREMFGYTARHIRETRKTVPLPGSRTQPSETVNDGWYIDAPARHAISCDRWKDHTTKGTSFVVARSQPIERSTEIRHGEEKTDFAVILKSVTKNTYIGSDGKPQQSTSTYESEVTRLEYGPLSPSLFDVPAGFVKVDRVRRDPGETRTVMARLSHWLKEWF
jgi:hypothetical protein